MGAGASTVSREEASKDAAFDAALWETLEKDDEGCVTMAAALALKDGARYTAPAPAPPSGPGPIALSTSESQVREAPALALSPKYVYPKHVAAPAIHQAVGHVKAAGFAAGTLITSVETPPELEAAELIVFKLSQLLILEGDKATSGFGTRYVKPTVSYYKMFKKLDLDGSRTLEKDEFVKTIRTTLGLTRDQVSDADLGETFDAIDKLEKNDGRVSLGEWAAFVNGIAAHASHRADPYNHAVKLGGDGKLSWGQDQPLEHFKFEDPTKAMPHYSDKLVVQKAPGMAANSMNQRDTEPAGLDALHLVLWHLTQHVATKKATGGLVYHPSHVSFYSMFKELDMQNNDRVTRAEWALALRRHVGVGPHVSDEDLGGIFDAVDVDNSDTISFAEFAAFARGASRGTHARGLAHMALEHHIS